MFRKARRVGVDRQDRNADLVATDANVRDDYTCCAERVEACAGALLTGADLQLRHRDWIVEMNSPGEACRHTGRFPARLFARKGRADGRRRTSASTTPTVYAVVLGMDAGEVAERLGDRLFS